MTAARARDPDRRHAGERRDRCRGRPLDATASGFLDDALRQVVGFSLFRRTGSRTANPTAQGVSLRGLGASGASRALVLADGIPLNDPFGGWVYWARQPRLGVERLEVLRGGAADLYGSGALGGVVQLVSRPAREGRGLEAELSAGGAATFEGDAHRARLARRVGGPALGRGLHARTATFRSRRRAGAPWTARPPRATSRWTHSSSGAASATAASSCGRRATTRTATTARRCRRTTRASRLGALGLDWGSAARGRTSVRAWAETQLFHQAFSAVAADRSREDLTRLQRVPADALGLSAQWTRPLGARQRLLLGAEARRVSGTTEEVVFTRGAPSSTVEAGGDETGGAVFVQDLIQAHPRLLVSTALRLDAWSQRGGRSIATPLATGVAADHDATRTATRRRGAHASVSLFRARPGLSLTASGYGAFRAPTLNELYRSFRLGDSLTLANPALEPERLWGGEVGALVTRGPHTLRLTAFSAEVQDAVANVTVATAPGLITRERQNVGRTRSRGLEAELDLRLGGRTTSDGGIRAHRRARDELPGRPCARRAAPAAGAAAPGDAPGPLREPPAARAAGAGGEHRLRGRPQRRWSWTPPCRSTSSPGYAVGRSVVLFAAAENVFDAEIVAARTPVPSLAAPRQLRAGVRVSR